MIGERFTPHPDYQNCKMYPAEIITITEDGGWKKLKTTILARDSREARMIAIRDYCGNEEYIRHLIKINPAKAT